MVKAESADELLEAAREAGWSQTYNRTPFENFRMLIEKTSDVEATRHTYTQAAFKGITGLGPSYIDNTYEGIDERTDTKIPGEWV